MKNQQRKYILHVLWVIIIMLISITLSLLYIKYIQNLIDKNTLKNLGELTFQDAENIKNKVSEHKRILDNLANKIDLEEEITSDKIFEIYKKSLAVHEFSRIGILYENGHCITNDGEILYLSDNKDYFFESDNIQISKSQKSMINQEEINIYSKRIPYDDTYIAILLVIETDDYEKLFTGNLFNGEGNEYIIDSNGTILANSNNRENGYNLFNILGTLKDKENLQKQEKIKSDIKSSLDGQVKFDISGKYYYTSYKYLGLNDWYLVIITPGSAIAQEYNKSLSTTFFFSIILNLGILITAIYIVLSNKRQSQKLYELAYIDKLTKLGNFNYFVENSACLLKQSNKKYYLIVFDIDKFKTFNRKYGRRTGDKLLQQIGVKLTKLVNSPSIISRLANDMFAILLENAQIPDDNLDSFIKKLNDELSNFIINNSRYKVLVSVGVYKIKEGEKDIFDVLDKALIAHDSVKGNYNQKYKIFDNLSEEKILEEHYFEIKMNDGIEKHEFEVYYQPKIDSKTGKLKEAEALVRWKIDGNTIPPNKFISLFERNKFIIKLDTYIFEQVCKDVSEWNSKYNKLIKVSVNISREHLLDKDFIQDYCAIANKYNLSPKDVQLEITEGATADYDANLLAILNNIKQAGFEIAIDDFGTGYSSLSVLQNLPVDVIKIDKSFVSQPKMLEIIMMIAKNLGLKTVVEGVETSEQVAFLRDLGVDLLQGYYYSKPVEKEEFEGIIKSIN